MLDPDSILPIFTFVNASLKLPRIFARVLRPEAEKVQKAGKNVWAQVTKELYCSIEMGAHSCAKPGVHLMYSICQEQFGFRLIFDGQIDAPEMGQWLEESSAALRAAPKPLGILMDLRGLRPGAIEPRAQWVLEDGLRLYRNAGLLRSCVVVENAAMANVLRRVAQAAGVLAHQRTIHATVHGDWFPKALGWIVSEVEPEAGRRATDQKFPVQRITSTSIANSVSSNLFFQMRSVV